MKTVLQEIIQRDLKRLEKLVEIRDSNNPIIIPGFKEEVMAKIEECAGKIIMNEMLLGKERRQLDSAFRNGISARKKSSFRYRHYF